MRVPSQSQAQIIFIVAVTRLCTKRRNCILSDLRPSFVLLVFQSRTL